MRYVFYKYETVKKIFLIFCLSFISIVAFSQTGSHNQDTLIYTAVDEMPGYPGGDEARIRFIQSHIVYPEAAKKAGIQGNVYATFVVEKDGSLTNIRILKGISGGCNEEVIRIVKAMPKWSPGKLHGKPVRVQFNLPVKFTLQKKINNNETTLKLNDSLLVAGDTSDKTGTGTVADTMKKYTIVDVYPKFPGGEMARNQFLKVNIHYPDKAVKERIEGTVMVIFVIEDDGSLSNIRISKGIGGGCDEEAIRAVKTMPRWEPGIYNGKAVKVLVRMPVIFKIPGKQ
jgi:TonB family protein